MALDFMERIMIRQLRDKGYSIRRIAREFGINRKTVRRYLRHPDKENYSREKPYISKLDDYKEYLNSRFKDYPEITADKLYREIKDKGFVGSYRAVAYYAKEHRPEKEQQAFVRYETEPGEQAQVDWAEFGEIDYYGRKCKLYCFCFVLGYSRRHYIEFTTRMDIHTLIRCHQRAFEYFGGVPRKILYDNMKQVVILNPGDKDKIQYNQQFIDFANTYGFIPMACDVAQAHQKGKIEKVVGYVRTSFFCGEKFDTLDELNTKAIYWCKNTADTRIHGTTHERPIDRWPAEKESLQSLPDRKYDNRKVVHRLVQKDCYLNYEGNCYSVPWQYVRKTVVVKGDENQIQIFYDDKCIATHRLCKEKGRYIRNPEHYKGLRIIRDNRKEKYRQEFASFGDTGIRYFEAVLNSSISNPYHHLNIVAKLKDMYPVSEIEKALNVALRFKAFQSKTVVNIVRKQIPPYGINNIEKILTVSGFVDNFQQVEERPLEFYDWVTKEKTNG